METLIFIVIVAAAIIFLAIKARQGTDNDTNLLKVPAKKE